MTPQQRCVQTARSYIGTKWRHLGRQPWAIDCIGLLVHSVAAGGIQMCDRTNYSRAPWRDGLRAELVAHFGEAIDGDLEPGDVVLIQWPSIPEPSHVAIVGDYAHGGLSLIHAHSDFGVAEHRLDDSWQALIVAAYRPSWGAE